MEDSLVEELDSDSRTKSDEASISNFKQNDALDINGDGDLWEEDGSLWNVSPRASNNAADLDREWQRRRDQFHTIGYRDGLIAGKEASAQDGFNVGFKQSVIVGYNWGLVRGVTSVLACLPDELTKRLIGSEEKFNSFQSLYDSVHSQSTSNSLSLFDQDINSTAKQSIGAETNFNEPDLSKQNSDFSLLGKYIQEFQALFLECNENELMDKLKSWLIQIRKHLLNYFKRTRLESNRSIANQIDEETRGNLHLQFWDLL